MPIYPGGPAYGLGLWNSVPATLAIEFAMFAAGLWIYTTATRARDAVGRWAFAGLVVFLVAAYLAAAFGGPPPSVMAIWVVGIAGAVVIVAWGAWVDRHRAPAGSVGSG
jgi:FtsH-binding integral membrane protein